MPERNFGMIISNQLLHSLEEVCRIGTLVSLLVTSCCTVWRKGAGKACPEWGMDAQFGGSVPERKAWYGAWMQSSGKSNTRKKRSVPFTQRMCIIISFEAR